MQCDGRVPRLKIVLASFAALIAGLLTVTVGSAAGGTWTATGSMAVARTDAVAASLPNGDVLVAGGGGCGAALTSAEIYHASGATAGTWSAAGSMSVGRYGAAASVLGDGKVLVAGGATSSCTPTASAELYDPASNTWTTTGSMQFARGMFTATRTAPQSVVVAGGFGDAGVSATSEEYSEINGSWTRLPNMNVGRQSHAAVALPGRAGTSPVMVLGGISVTSGGITPSVEIGQTPDGGVAGFSWSQAPTLNVSRDEFTATLLGNGNVLAAGGSSNSGYNQATAEVWAGPTWTQVAKMGSIRNRHTATLLGDGRVLVAGGNNTYSLNTAELFDPVSATWTSTGPMTAARSGAIAAPLPGGGVLVAGGVPGISAAPLASAETFALAPASNPVPVLSGPTSLSPGSTQAGGPALTLNVTGSTFINGSQVLWNGAPLSTTYVSATQLSAAVPASDLASAACAAVAVFTPAPGGGTSALQAFSITPAAPSGSGVVTVTGADCSGATDSTPAFLTALNQLVTQSGGTLVVPPGRYLVQPGQLIVHGNTTVSGAGASLTASASGYALLDLSGSNIEVDDLGLDGASQVLHVVEVEKGANNLTLRRVNVQNAGQDLNPASSNYSAQTVGIRVQGDGRTMLFDRVSVRNVLATHSDGTSMVARGLLFDNGGGALTVSKQVTVQNSSFVNVGPKDDGDCLVIQGSTDTDAGLLIVNNTFDQCHKRAIKLQVGGATVQNNTINNPFNGNNAYQVRPEPNGKPTFDMFSGIGLFSSNILLTGNSLTGVGSFYEGVEIDSIGGTPQNLSIVRNTIANGAASQTGAPSSLIRSSVAIANLTIRANTLTNAPFGLYLEQPVTGASIGCDTYANVASRSANANAVEQPCGSTPPDPTTARQSLAIPSYFYPGAAWGQLDAGAPTVGLAIINPNSGPGNTVNFDYVNQVQQSRAKGLSVLGYVPTGYGSRPTAAVKRDIDTYYAWYDVDGIFLDEASTDCRFEQAYADLNGYVKAKGGIARTVLNPGTPTSECYMAAADVVVTFEGPATSYLAGYASPSWVANYPAARFWHLVYATSTDQDMQNVVALSKLRSAGWIYVTPDDLPNPWDTLPSDPYWSDELSAASAAPAPAPKLDAVTPTSAQVRSTTGSNLSVTLTGSGFSGASTALWKRSTDTAPTALATTFVSASELTAIIPASDLSTSGAADITVTTRPPGGGTSVAEPFFVIATSATLVGPPASQTSSSSTGAAAVSTGQGPAGTAGAVSASATGLGTLTIAQYTADPQMAVPAGGDSNYFDVHTSSGSTFGTVTVVDCNLSGTPADPAFGILQWWDGTAWRAVSNQTPAAPNTSCTTANLSATSSPSVSQLVGTAFAVVVDRTPPRVTYTGNTGSYGVLGTVNITCAAADEVGGSGLASTTCQDVTGPAYNFMPGSNTFSATATDRAGNIGTGSTSFTVAVKPADLCTLTVTFVQASTRYRSLPPSERTKLDQLTNALCQHLSMASIAPAQKAQIVAAYQAGVAALVRPGWLTQAQATILVKLSKAV